MLPTNLTSNEVKDSAGAEVEFTRISTESRSVSFAKSTEAPNQPYRLKVSHQETGSGVARRRRSLVRFDYPVTGVNGTIENIAVYGVADIPVGNLSATTGISVAIAHFVSFMASQGASTTILYDTTGYGAAAMVNGTL